jgi:hypothetical protein
VFEGTDGKAYGNVTLPRDLTIESGETLTIPAGASLTVPSGTTLTVESGGTIDNNGTITVKPGGTLTVESGGTLNNYGGATIEYTIDIAAIPGVTVPVTGAAPVTAIETDQYTGTDERSPQDADKFAAGTVDTATITLTPNPGRTLTGVAANSFTVAGATSVSNAEGAGIVTAVFPATGSAGGSPGGSSSGGCDAGAFGLAGLAIAALSVAAKKKSQVRL